MNLFDYFKHELDNEDMGNNIDHAVRCCQMPDGSIDFYIHPACRNGSTADFKVMSNGQVIPKHHVGVGK